MKTSWYFNIWYFVTGVLLFSLSKIFQPYSIGYLFDLFYIHFVLAGIGISLVSFFELQKAGIFSLKTARVLMILGLIFYFFGNLSFGVGEWSGRGVIDSLPNFLFLIQVLTKQYFLVSEFMDFKGKESQAIFILNLSIFAITILFKDIFTSYAMVDLFFLFESLLSCLILTVLNITLVPVGNLTKYLLISNAFWLLADFNYLEEFISFLGSMTDFLYFLGVVWFVFAILEFSNKNYSRKFYFKEDPKISIEILKD